MTHVWLGQCLCPKRHAIIAAAGEAEDQRDAEHFVLAPLREQIATLLRDGTINPWCGLCGARSDIWVFEVRRSRFLTMAEATPHLRQVEGLNIATKVLLGKY